MARLDDVSSRFWEKVDRRGHDECWEWMRARNHKGYGLVKVGGRMCGAHRMAYRLTHGEPGHGMFVCHSCDNRSCCNPSHLFLGSHSDNMMDAARKQRMPHKLSPDDAVAIRAMKRDGVSMRAIARQFGVCKNTVEQVVYRITFKYVVN